MENKDIIKRYKHYTNIRYAIMSPCFDPIYIGKDFDDSFICALLRVCCEISYSGEYNIDNLKSLRQLICYVKNEGVTIPYEVTSSFLASEEVLKNANNDIEVSSLLDYKSREKNIFKCYKLYKQDRFSLIVRIKSDNDLLNYIVDDMKYEYRSERLELIILSLKKLLREKDIDIKEYGINYKIQRLLLSAMLEIEDKKVKCECVKILKKIRHE